ncbi:hypothetical protein OG866_43185 [Streptomyces sp. NBC_00663]|uniref:hypothetical protein n=1 Tax=Streptomyces sp. NBC_00663 TaxID=2975801 RepID=UPI002E2EB987|nr:hypothetical protein [Streptomyces sp. NBC_00663]
MTRSIQFRAVMETRRRAVAAGGGASEYAGLLSLARVDGDYATRASEVYVVWGEHPRPGTRPAPTGADLGFPASPASARRCSPRRTTITRDDGGGAARGCA